MTIKFSIAKGKKAKIRGGDPGKGVRSTGVERCFIIYWILDNQAARLTNRDCVLIDLKKTDQHDHKNVSTFVIHRKRAYFYSADV